MHPPGYHHHVGPWPCWQLDALPTTWWPWWNLTPPSWWWWWRRRWWWWWWWWWWWRWWMHGWMKNDGWLMCASWIFSFIMPAFSPSPSPSPSPSSVFSSSRCTPSRPNESWTPHLTPIEKKTFAISPGIFRISSHKIPFVDLLHSPSKSGSSLCTLSPNHQIAMCPKTQQEFNMAFHIVMQFAKFLFTNWPRRFPATSSQ